ncbi:F-box only protein 5 [Brachyhypopomus gauderio]|uniref:F-box only protein 5 n=1 Tax=Brachyhypopomus gauderio TaxID=698409 RepID=UPI00404324F0
MKCLTRSKTSRHTENEKVEDATRLKGPATAPKICATQSGDAPRSAGISRHGEDLTGPHNKENCEEKPCCVEDIYGSELVLSSCGSAEDSGYLSLHNSQIDHGDADTEGCRQEIESRLSPDVCSRSPSACLPVLKFQEEVCKELAKSYRKNQSYDWTVVDKIAENYSLHNVIGGKMGLDYVDIFYGLLKKDMKHVLTKILVLLDESDLINCKLVSKTWLKIICQDERALQRCRQAEKMPKAPGRSVGSLSRNVGLSRVVFSCLQSVASSTPVHKPAKKTVHHTDNTLTTPKSSRFTEFFEAAKSLKVHEELRCCRLCGSPARFNPAAQRAMCTRASCLFEFCSLCQSAYHGSAPCQRGVVRLSPRSQNALIAGSARSKRSVRRL